MPSILVIDDDASIAETLDLYLTEEGYNVRTALTGTEGLNQYVQEQSDVVILDIRLQGNHDNRFSRYGNDHQCDEERRF